MPHIQAVIFDLDGTLADTFPLIVASWNAACRGPMGREYSAAEVIAHFGLPDIQMLRAELPRPAWAEAERRYFGHYQNYHSSVQSFEGVDEMLRELRRRGLPLGVFTGKGRSTADISLRELGWSGLFGAVVTGDDVACQKPHPEGLVKAAADLGVDISQSLYAGDSPSDVKAGRAAGALTVGAGWHGAFEDKLRAEEPDFWADKPVDIVALCVPS